jgi:putative transcriptional regulator
MELLTGKLLVAASTSDDPIYSRGVCLVVHHDLSGAIGVMLNRPMQPDAAALMQLIGQEEDEGNRIAQAVPPTGSAPALGAVHFGGPLSGPVVAIHPLSQYGEAETGHGIYVAAQKEHLEQLVRQQPCPYRLIVGHLGWDADALQEELDAGLWHVIPATVDVVFCNAAQMWPGLIRAATSRSLAKWIGLPPAAIGAGELN